MIVRRGSVARGASVVALAAVLLASGRADAAPDQPWVVTHKSVSINKSGRVECSEGVAVGGGVRAANRFSSYLARSEPYPRTGTPTGWAGRVSNLHPDADVVDEYGQVFVLCATGVTATTRRKHFDGDEGDVSCAAGESALSGGVGVDVPATTLVTSSAPSPTFDEATAWSARLDARDGSAPGATVYVVCAPGVRAVPRWADLSDVLAAPGRPGEVATGGGVRSLANLTYVAGTAPGYAVTDYDAPEQSWTGQVTLLRRGLTSPGRGRVAVVCATASPGSTALVPLAPSRLIGTLISAYAWRYDDTSSRLTALTLGRVPSGGRFEALCSPEGSCPFVSVGATFPKGRPTADVLPIFGSASRRAFRAGTRVQIRMTDAGKIGKAWTFAIRAGREPLVSAGCIPEGSTDVQAAC